MTWEWRSMKITLESIKSYHYVIAPNTLPKCPHWTKLKILLQGAMWMFFTKSPVYMALVQRGFVQVCRNGPCTFKYSKVDLWKREGGTCVGERVVVRVQWE